MSYYTDLLAQRAGIQVNANFWANVVSANPGDNRAVRTFQSYVNQLNDINAVIANTAPDPTPAPTQGYTPAPTQGYTPAPTQGYTPAPTQGYTPAPTQGYTPAPTQGYTPAPTQGYTPAPTQGYTPAPVYTPAPTMPPVTTMPPTTTPPVTTRPPTTTIPPTTTTPPVTTRPPAITYSKQDEFTVQRINNDIPENFSWDPGSQRWMNSNITPLGHVVFFEANDDLQQELNKQYFETPMVTNSPLLSYGFKVPSIISAPLRDIKRRSTTPGINKGG